MLQVDDALVAEHALRVSQISKVFGERMRMETEKIGQATINFILSRISARDGLVLQSAQNSEIILKVEETFKRELTASSYYPMVHAVVPEFVDQVKAFGAINKTVGGLPEHGVLPDDVDVLSDHVGAFITLAEGQGLDVVSHLRRTLGQAMGRDLTVASLSAAIFDAASRLNSIELLFKDHLMFFFRLVGSLHYGHIEEGGTSLLYQYVGDVGKHTRDFCANLCGRLLTLPEISELDNGQVPGVFTSGGGRGCQHWWLGVDVA